MSRMNGSAFADSGEGSAYPIASLTYAGLVLRKFGYKATFMLGLTLYGIGALLFWPAAMKRSFGVSFFLPGFAGFILVWSARVEANSSRRE